MRSIRGGFLRTIFSFSIHTCIVSSICTLPATTSAHSRSWAWPDKSALRLLLPPQNRVARGPGLVHARDRQGLRRVFDALGIVQRFVVNPFHRIDEAVQDFLALGLGRFNHQRTDRKS